MVCAGSLDRRRVLEAQTPEKQSRGWRRRRRLRLECNSICCFPLVVIIKRFVVVGFNICIWQSRVSPFWSLFLPLSLPRSLSLILYFGFFGGTTRLFLLLCYTLFLLLLNNNFWFLVFLRRRHQGPAASNYKTTRRRRRRAWTLDKREAMTMTMLMVLVMVMTMMMMSMARGVLFVFPSIITTNVSSNSFIFPFCLAFLWDRPQ